MNRHLFWMVIGCVAPLALIFILPVIGIRGTWPVAVGLGAMFVIHLLMMMGHRHEDEDQEGQEKGKDPKETNHGHH